MLAAEVYAKELSHLGHGRPLWIPEPPNGIEILIGDVGYFLGGRFYRLFNVTKPHDDPVNVKGVPTKFEVLDLEPQPLHSVDELFPPKASICSMSVSATDVTAEIAASAELLNVGGGASYRFTCGTEQGALLLLKDCAASQEVHPSSRLFVDYMRTHYRKWCAFALDKYKLELKPEEIVFVRGWVKTTEWALAAFLQGGSGQELSLQAEGASLVKARFSVTNSQHHSTSVFHRTGPRRTEGSVTCPSPPQDQCIFLSYFKLKRSLFSFKIVAAAEPRVDYAPRWSPEPDSSHDGELDGRCPTPDSDYSVHADPEHAPSWDPLDDVLDYILETSGMDLAIASHCSLRQLQWPRDNDIKSALKQLRPPLTVLDSQVGILEAEFSALTLPSAGTSNAFPDISTAIDDTLPELMEGVASKEVVQKPQCLRCKALNLKCEFKTEPDISKGWSNCGPEWVVVEAERRLAPPKREHLLSEIREQADRINKLMAELEKANIQSTPAEDVRRNHRAPSSQSSATLVGSAESVSYLSSYDDWAPSKSAEPSSYVRDWLAKGRQAMNEFDGYIHSAEQSLEPPELYESDEEVDDLSDSDDSWGEGVLPIEDFYEPHRTSMLAKRSLNRAGLDSVLQSRKRRRSRPTPSPPSARYSSLSLPKLQSARKLQLPPSSSSVNTSGAMSSPGLFSSPSAHPSSSQADYQGEGPRFTFDFGALSTLGAHAPLRPIVMKELDGEGLGAGVSNPIKAAKAVKRSACLRCRGLKVKCEYKTDSNICGRCLEDGQECVAPARSTRGSSLPKREHLLSQIRRQTDRINKLMTKLQKANRNTKQGFHASFRHSLPVVPMAGPSTPIPSPLPNIMGYSNPQDTPSANAVGDWLAKAQQSMDVFGEFLEAGRSSNALVTVTEEDEHSANYDSASNDGYSANLEVDEEDVGEGLPTTSLGSRKRSRSDSPTSDSRPAKRVLMLPPNFIPNPNRYSLDRTAVARENPLDDVSDRLSQPFTSSDVEDQPSLSADRPEPSDNVPRPDASSSLGAEAPDSRGANPSEDDDDQSM